MDIVVYFRRENNNNSCTSTALLDKNKVEKENKKNSKSNMEVLYVQSGANALR